MGMDGLFDSVKLLLREFDGFMSRLARWLCYREWSSRDVGVVGLLLAIAAVTWYVLHAAQSRRMKRRHTAHRLEL
jgi:hypothetical protein